MEREVRVTSDLWPDADLEIRAESDSLNFRGYAAVFDSPSEDLGGFRETIAQGAFAESLRRRKGDIKMFVNHDWNVVLGSKGAGTLRLKEDAHGLFVDADLPDNEWGRPVRDAVVRGDISGMSFGFTVPKGGDAWNEDRSQRELRNVYLLEVSPVTSWPAYAATSASVRELAEMVDEEPDAIVTALRDFLSTEHEPSTETRRLMKKLLDAREPAPTVDPDELDYIRSRLALRAALDAYIPAPDPDPDHDPDHELAPVAGTSREAPRTPTNDKEEVSNDG
jgi:HK97 family phage prohead protease